MLPFSLLVILTLAPVAAVMLLLFRKARDVPDESESTPEGRRRLNPDQLRGLAYLLVVLICLAAALIELYLHYG